MPTTRMQTFDHWQKRMADWPKSWPGLPEDIPLGEGLVAHMMPFVEHLLNSGLAPSTVRRHIDNLWLVGGEIVKDASIYNQLKRPAEEFLEKAVGPFDGLLISDLTESEQRSVDSTCRKFYKFRHKKK